MNDLPLYVITHSELSSGYQTAQSIHATANIALEHPEAFAHWHANGQRVVALEVRDEEDLWALIEKALLFPEANFQVVRFHEPDLDNALTAFALVPNRWNALLTQGLKLAGTATGLLNKHTFESAS